MKVLGIFLLSLGCIVAFSAMSEAVREDDLALYLSFDEAKGDTAKDKSKHGNDGTIHKGKRVKGKHWPGSRVGAVKPAVGSKCQIPILWISLRRSP